MVASSDGSALPSVVLALFGGLAVAVLAFKVLRAITTVDPAKTVGGIDVTRIALTVAAGGGGVVALVIAYRRQRDTAGFESATFSDTVWFGNVTFSATTSVC
ncbi:hypothetical protein [Nocardia jejuensis]|uniref:hypothetical protein n=1 Tax=Nocardia jejuensis TaxID=328049 RepID=UPI000833DB97|nr:hypothetical protein [Nocardia jejuensis]